MKTLLKASTNNRIPSPFGETKRAQTPAVPEPAIFEPFNEYSDPSDLDESFEIIPDVMVSQHVDIEFKEDESAYTQAYNEYKKHILKNT